MTRFVTLAAALAALALPATAPAKVLHFKGKATDKAGSPNLVISFDVTASKGRATRIADVYVERADFGCQNRVRTERNVRFFKSAAVARNGRFELRETQAPPGADNWLTGQVLFPKTKNGKRAPLRVKGFLSAEFGFGLKRNEYNCIAADHFTATRIG